MHFHIIDDNLVSALLLDSPYMMVAGSMQDNLPN